jgi:hypothetical protein
MDKPLVLENQRNDRSGPRKWKSPSGAGQARSEAEQSAETGVACAPDIQDGPKAGRIARQVRRSEGQNSRGHGYQGELDDSRQCQTFDRGPHRYHDCRVEDVCREASRGHRHEQPMGSMEHLAEQDDQPDGQTRTDYRLCARSCIGQAPPLGPYAWAAW